MSSDPKAKSSRRQLQQKYSGVEPPRLRQAVSPRKWQDKKNGKVENFSKVAGKPDSID